VYHFPRYSPKIGNLLLRKPNPNQTGGSFYERGTLETPQGRGGSKVKVKALGLPPSLVGVNTGVSSVQVVKE
jgi:hypothetical protein